MMARVRYYEFQCIVSNFSFIFQVKKSFCYQTLFWPFTVWMNCSKDLIIFENSPPSTTNFKSFFQSPEHFFLTVGQNNFVNKIPFHYFLFWTQWSVSENNERFLLWNSISTLKKIKKKGSSIFSWFLLFQLSVHIRNNSGQTSRTDPALHKWCHIIFEITFIVWR